MRADVQRVLELIQGGDRNSLEQALSLLQDTVFSFSMKVCGQKQDAEDTMQEVLLRSIPNLPKFDSPRALAVWLYKVAKTRCLISRRRSKFAPKEALSLEDLMPDRRELESLSAGNDGTPEVSLMRRENAKLLRQAVQRLPPDYRLILVLHDMEELNDEEIAEITGLRAGTIRVRLHRARLFVRKELARKVSSRTKSKRGAAVSQPTHAPGRNCKQLFAELSDYLDDELDDSLCAELEKHLRGCAPCQAFLSTLEKSIEQCRASPNEPLDPVRAANLRRELLAEYQKVISNALAGKPSAKLGT